MESTVTIQFDCSDRLERVLKDIAEGLSVLKSVPATTTTTRSRRAKTTSVEPTKTEEAPTPVNEEPKNEAPIILTPAKKEEETKVEEAEVEDSTPAPTVKVSTVTEISDADLRKAMNACRKRILGDNINDAILKMSVNNMLRGKVSELGCQTSTELNQEQRVVFVEFCEKLEMNVSDELPY